MEYNKVLNHFLVNVFNELLISQEKSLKVHSDGELSLVEMHIIEKICEQSNYDQNSMSLIAKKLNVTVGTLTVAVKTLEKKGYVERKKLKEDKRIVILVPTEKALKINEIHADFHENMIKSITELLSEEQLRSFTLALKAIEDYFSTATKQKYQNSDK